MARKTRPPLRPRSKPVEKGTPLTYSHAVERRYQDSLERLIDGMTETYGRDLRKLFDSPKAENTFDAEEDQSFAYAARVLTNALAKRFILQFGNVAQSLADTMLKGVERQSALQLGSSIHSATGATLNTDVLTPRVRQIVGASVTENVALIKSIPTQYADSIQQAVMRSIVSGRGMADLQPDILKLNGQQRKRAGLIARDQTSKATSAINVARMKDLGVRKFEWLHSSGSKEPRPMHVEMSGNVYSMDDPPVIDPDGTRGFPGELINCRCRMVPVVDFSDD